MPEGIAMEHFESNIRRLFRVSLKRNKRLEIVMALSVRACCGKRRAGQMDSEALNHSKSLVRHVGLIQEKIGRKIRMDVCKGNRGKRDKRDERNKRNKQIGRKRNA